MKPQKKKIPPDGRIRESQVVGSYGAGSMIDLVDHAVLMPGLDAWFRPGDTNCITIENERLRRWISKRYGVKLSSEGYFRRPPVGDPREPTRARGIHVRVFPYYHVCTTCRRLGREATFTKETHGLKHYCGPGQDGENREGRVVPVRFVAACPDGHVQDVPWDFFVHNGKDCKNGPAKLRLIDSPDGDFSKIKVVCTSCGDDRRLAEARKKEGQFQKCSGRSPWLYPPPPAKDCERKLRLLVRTASNSYFPLTTSALLLPEPETQLPEESDLTRDVRRVLAGEGMLKEQTEDALRGAIAYHPQVGEIVGSYDRDDVVTEAKRLWAEQASSKDEKKPEPSLRFAEYQVLSQVPFEEPGKPRKGTLYARKIPVPEVLAPWVEQIVMVHRLTIVRVQYGFTRLEPPTLDSQGELEIDLGVKPAPLGTDTRWLPASTDQGEGIFIRFRKDRLEEWEAHSEVKKRAKELEDGYREWEKSWGKEGGTFPGARYILLHSFSHLLIEAISVSCGYAASAISERIYSARSADNESGEEMSAVMLYTGTAGADGTLGGLVAEARNLELHFKQALLSGSLCSNDPICASHVPTDLEERYREGAACYGCLHIAEPSCERFNRELDRCLVVPCVGHDKSLAFFSEPL